MGSLKTFIEEKPSVGEFDGYVTLVRTSSEYNVKSLSGKTFIVYSDTSYSVGAYVRIKDNVIIGKGITPTTSVLVQV